MMLLALNILPVWEWRWDNGMWSDIFIKTPAHGSLAEEALYIFRSLKVAEND